MERRHNPKLKCYLSDSGFRNQIYTVTQEEMRTQYNHNRGYACDKPVTLSEFRSVRLTTKQKGLMVQARQKYWAKR